MARAVEAHWEGAPLSGLVVTRHGHGEPCRRINVLEASHPVPDRLGVEAAEQMLTAVRGLREDDLVLALISGGGSALMSLPAAGVTLADKQAVVRALLHSGAPIDAINTVRRHLSAIKGGRLALAAAPARVATFLISDVPSNDPALVASGPTIPDCSSRADALRILEQYHIETPDSVSTLLSTRNPDPVRPDDVRLARNTVATIANAAGALDAARAAAVRSGVDVHVLGDAIEGEAREVGRLHALQAYELRKSGLRRPLLLLSGGETSVTVRGGGRGGRGGRNVEYLLGLALALDGLEGVYALAADTDGIDGSEDNAGAVLRPDTLARARDAGMDAAARLKDNDAYGFFEALDDLLVTGPTRTNVNDFRAILIQP